ncbi:MAG: PA2779 family protein [Saccharospirillum sp.]|nr:PA2779 family protein [Saccharospirillum sp.]
MKQSRVSRWITVVSLVFTLLATGLTAQTAVAGIIGTETLMQEQSGTLSRDDLQSLIARGDVQEKLIDYGISPEQAAERVAALTDTELQHLAIYMDDEPAGGNVTLILLIILLILLLR